MRKRDGEVRSRITRAGAHFVRAKVEHLFLIIKRIFGFVKTRYKGLAKNAHQLFVTCALANLYMMRRRLLRLAGA